MSSIATIIYKLFWYAYFDTHMLKIFFEIPVNRVGMTVREE